MRSELVSSPNNMNILFIGDIVGSVGREMVRCHLPLLKSRYDIDLVVGNGENAAHGKGITRRIYHQLISYGIDVMTHGQPHICQERPL